MLCCATAHSGTIGPSAVRHTGTTWRPTEACGWTGGRDGGPPACPVGTAPATGRYSTMDLARASLPGRGRSRTGMPFPLKSCCPPEISINMYFVLFTIFPSFSYCTVHASKFFHRGRRSQMRQGKLVPPQPPRATTISITRPPPPPPGREPPTDDRPNAPPTQQATPTATLLMYRYCSVQNLLQTHGRVYSHFPRT